MCKKIVKLIQSERGQFKYEKLSLITKLASLPFPIINILYILY